ncbi:MAG TPA: AAA family ATPase [Verrucomicrobiae bacterium]|nr:AAA family ATPase [Verrucomicrobiae bacterium]
MSGDEQHRNGSRNGSVSRDDPNPFEVLPLEEYETEAPRYLWDPYLRLGQINLLDAKGGSGKTTFCVALAVQGSLGHIPWAGECEPFKTLYFGHEDTPGEIRTLYEQMGGRPGFFFPMTKPFMLTQPNVKRVRDTIDEVGAKLVVFDSITYYLGDLIKNAFNGMEIAPHLARLRDVARGADCCITNIRHFKQGTAGIDASDMGSGSEQWRNSHRSQLVLRPHPDARNHPRFGIIEHTKGSLLAPRGLPFGFQFKDGQFGWVPSEQIDLSVFDRAKDVTATKVTMQVSDVVDWLKAKLSDGPIASNELFDMLQKDGGSRNQAFEAKKVLPITATPIGAKGRKGLAGWLWTLKVEEQEDPFADD